MQIVIDIPEEYYKAITEIPNYQCTADMLIIKNGTPLPKGHGRILDEKDILDTENNDGGWYDLVDMPEYIAGVKAIIGADKAESEPQEGEGAETWNGIHAQITAPKGTFERIFNEADEDNDILATGK